MEVRANGMEIGKTRHLENNVERENSRGCQVDEDEKSRKGTKKGGKKGTEE